MLDIRTFGANGEAAGDDSAAIAAAFAAAAGTGQQVYIPPSTLGFTLNQAVTIPAGVHLVIEGLLTGTGWLACAGDVAITGRGTLRLAAQDPSGNFGMVMLSRGSCLIDGPRFDCVGLPAQAFAAIQVNPSAPIDLLRVRNCHFEQVCFGIARQAPNGAAVPVAEEMSVRSAMLVDNTGHDFTGDCIEWNIGYNDVQLTIAGNQFEYVHGTLPNLGIGIGVAGKGPYSYDNPQRQKRIFIHGNRVRSATTGLHVEVSEDVYVCGNLVDDIQQCYSPNLDFKGIVVYGSRGSVVSENMVINSPAAWLYVAMGFNAPLYANSTEDSVVAGNRTIGSAGIQTVISRAPSDTLAYPNRLIVKDNVVLDGILGHLGVCDLTIAGNVVRHPLGAIGFKLDYDFDFGEAGVDVNDGFMFNLHIADNDVRDKFGNPGYVISDLNIAGQNGNCRVTGGGNSFPVVTGAALAVTPTSRSYVWNNPGFPYGREFQQGDVVHSGDGRIFLVTAGGSRSFAGDACTIVSAANGTVASAGPQWNDAHLHTFGQRLTLGSGTATRQVIVGKVYEAGGIAQMQLIDAATGAVANLAGLSGTVPVRATAEIAFTHTPGRSGKKYQAPTGVASRATFNIGTVTLIQLARRVKALIDDSRTTGANG